MQYHIHLNITKQREMENRTQYFRFWARLTRRFDLKRKHCAKFNILTPSLTLREPRGTIIDYNQYDNKEIRSEHKKLALKRF